MGCKSGKALEKYCIKVYFFNLLWKKSGEKIEKLETLST